MKMAMSYRHDCCHHVEQFAVEAWFFVSRYSKMTDPAFVIFVPLHQLSFYQHFGFNPVDLGAAFKLQFGCKLWHSS